MNYLITGATGYIGIRLAHKLAAQGQLVHALYRSEKKVLPLREQPNIRLFRGDILERESLEKAMQSCDGVYHVAAFAKPWTKDSQTFYRVNVEGALNVFEMAKKAGVRRVVFTSTAGVISPSDGMLSDENTPGKFDYSTHYERSKAAAEKIVLKLVKEGQDIVIVNPSRVYGPGLLSESNGATKMIKLYLQGKFRLLPGNGQSIGNYVFIDDVVEGHIKAMDKGRAGERYLLGGENASFIEFFDLLSEVAGKRSRMLKMPIWAMNLAAHLLLWRATTFGIPPLITPPWVRKYLFHWELSIEKARRELGYEPMGLREGFQKTLAWLDEQNRKTR
jgi:nucleoside-diphosphate-sugar epimerase